jgi:hypothetical protein
LQQEAAARTDLDGRNAEAARLEGNADAAGRDALAEPAHHPAGHKHVLHLAPDKSPQTPPPPQSPGDARERL